MRLNSNDVAPDGYLPQTTRRGEPLDCGNQRAARAAPARGRVHDKPEDLAETSDFEQLVLSAMNPTDHRIAVERHEHSVVVARQQMREPLRHRPLVDRVTKHPAQLRDSRCIGGRRAPDLNHHRTSVLSFSPMPVSTSSSQVIYDALKANGIRLLSALPETWLVHLIRMAEEDPDMVLVRLAKEEEGVGISAGAHMAGVKSAMLMQNHGFLASINGIVSCAQLYRIPLLMLISYRGEFGERDPWQTEGGAATEDLLRALRIPFAYLDSPDHVALRIRKAQTLATSANKPVALLLCRDLMWEEPA